MTPVNPIPHMYTDEMNDATTNNALLLLSQEEEEEEVPETAAVDAICIGSGRFLRSVLIPALNAIGCFPVVIQTRGTSFMEYLKKKNDCDNNMRCYEVDTVMPDGTVTTELVPVYGAGSLGPPKHKDAVMSFLRSLRRPPRFIGVGVTEAGLAKGSKAMSDIFDILKLVHENHDWNAIDYNVSVINTDNVPNNGDVIRQIMLNKATDIQENCDKFIEFLKNRVTFHNSMVDRITSQREGSNGDIPKCEPTPSKALVLEDLKGVLPNMLRNENISRNFGIIIRDKQGQLSSDIALKLRVANGTHTAIAHVMALSSIQKTDFLAKENNDTVSRLLMNYLDVMVDSQIQPASKLALGEEIDVPGVYDDWRKRLCHAHFGLSTFFITQNGAAKGGIRIGPTIRDLLMNGMV